MTIAEIPSETGMTDPTENSSEICLTQQVTHLKLSSIKRVEEYRSLIDRYSPTEYQSFKKSISKEGVIVPIEVNEDLDLLDGYHRFQASLELEREYIPTHIHSFKGDSLVEKSFVIRCNLERRHLTPFQRIELVMKLEPIEAELARSRELAGKTLVQNYTTVNISGQEQKEKGCVVDILARRARVSPMTYFMGKEILKIPRCEEELDRLRSGRLKISKVYKHDQKQRRVTQLLLQKPSIKLPEGCRLIHGDCREKGEDIPDNSIDLIFTDPPYADEYLELFKWWADSGIES